MAPYYLNNKQHLDKTKKQKFNIRNIERETAKVVVSTMPASISSHERAKSSMTIIPHVQHASIDSQKECELFGNSDPPIKSGRRNAAVAQQS